MEGAELDRRSSLSVLVPLLVVLGLVALIGLGIAAVCFARSCAQESRRRRERQEAAKYGAPSDAASAYGYPPPPPSFYDPAYPVKY